MLAIIIVFVLPPKLSCSRRVSLESLYGTCLLFPSTRADITFPKALSERLIFEASLSLSPTDPVLDCLSEPAKSTRLNLQAVNLSIYPCCSDDSICKVKIACDLDDYAFIRVSATDLLLFPILSNLANSGLVLTVMRCTSLMKTPFSGDYLISSLFLIFPESKS